MDQINGHDPTIVHSFGERYKEYLSSELGDNKYGSFGLFFSFKYSILQFWYALVMARPKLCWLVQVANSVQRKTMLWHIRVSQNFKRRGFWVALWQSGRWVCFLGGLEAMLLIFQLLDTEEDDLRL